MKNYIGVIGAGYWGSIVIKTLIKLGYKNLIVCDTNENKLNDIKFNSSYKLKVSKNYKELLEEVSHIFCLTPAFLHYDVCSYFLKNSIPVFCEKPLTLKVSQNKKLYSYGTRLFVDWIFNYNESFNYIVEKLLPTFGKLRSIEFNRLNFGPIRNDVNALLDLSSHDISMVARIIDLDVKKIKIFNYKMNKDSVQDDSNICFYNGDVKVLIKSSWEYNQKNRDVIFNFDNDILVWNDLNNKIYINGVDHNFKNCSSPLENSINTFFNGNEEQLKFNKKITNIVSSIILQDESKF